MTRNTSKWVPYWDWSREITGDYFSAFYFSASILQYGYVTFRSLKKI